MTTAASPPTPMADTIQAPRRIQSNSVDNGVTGKNCRLRRRPTLDQPFQSRGPPTPIRSLRLASACDAEQQRSLKQSPPTLPAETRLNKQPKKPNRIASNRLIGTSSACTNNRQRIKLSKFVDKTIARATLNQPQFFGCSRSAVHCASGKFLAT